ncbi:ABC-three component system protein [Fluviicola taffensis]|uniref:ABC-three component system protein n=1 Tax=Fluviicola taffensis TaxID=191579 RepID=UPI0031378FE5
MAKSVQEAHTAGAQSIGFDYQFYYFMFLLLELRHGQKIGFEVKDDVHIDKEDGTTILFQAKHTITKSAAGDPQNLTTLDSDLWKTLSNWTDFIKADNSNTFLDKHSFYLVTNKSESNNEFISSLNTFKEDNNVDFVLTKLNELKSRTQDETIQKYIKNISSVGKKKLSQFLSKLIIETEVHAIIEKIKNRILENVRQQNLVDPIYEKLYSNLQTAKYLDIEDRNKFEVSFEEFISKFGECFKVAFELKPLPKRDFPIFLPDDLESQTFIKQLLDIGEIKSGSNHIRDYTMQMLKFLNHFSYWSEENFILPTDVTDFKTNSIAIWTNEFRSKYRQIENRIGSGETIEDLENDINSLGIELVDYIRQKDLAITGTTSLGIEFSNGHYYALSNQLEIGWHFDWQNKYNRQ